MKNFISFKTRNGHPAAFGPVGHALLSAFRSNPEDPTEIRRSVKTEELLKAFMALEEKDADVALAALSSLDPLDEGNSFSLDDFFHILSNESGSNVEGLIMSESPSIDGEVGSYICKDFTLLGSTGRPRYLGPLLQKNLEEGNYRNYAAHINAVFVEPLLCGLSEIEREKVIEALLSAILADEGTRKKLARVA